MQHPGTHTKLYSVQYMELLITIVWIPFLGSRYCEWGPLNSTPRVVSTGGVWPNKVIL